MLVSRDKVLKFLASIEVRLYSCLWIWGRKIQGTLFPTLKPSQIGQRPGSLNSGENKIFFPMLGILKGPRSYWWTSTINQSENLAGHKSGWWHWWGYSHLSLTAGTSQFLWDCSERGRVGKGFQSVRCKAAKVPARLLEYLQQFLIIWERNKCRKNYLYICIQCMYTMMYKSYIKRL